LRPNLLRCIELARATARTGLKTVAQYRGTFAGQLNTRGVDKSLNRAQGLGPGLSAGLAMAFHVKPKQCLKRRLT